MMNSGSNLTYHIFKDYNIPFDEKGSTCGTIRKIQWVKEGNEPDESHAKIEIRKVYFNTSDGERLGKGYSFSTLEGPGELVQGMISAGFGDTKNILKELRKREDFVEAVKSIDEDPDDDSDGETFDMRDLLLGGLDEEDMEDAG